MESSLSLATREVMWNIPISFKVAMYLSLAVATAILFKGLFEKYQFVTDGKSVKELLPEKLNFKNLFQTLFFQGKVKRVKFVGLFNSLIFYGFIVLWIATDIVAIHYDTPFKIFQGTTYIVISWLADYAGIAILLGLALAFWRRYVERPDYLSATKPKQELFMYGMLLNLVVIGYVIEGFRILGTGMPTGEASWAPIGWALASCIKDFGMSDFALAMSYRGLWLFHMLMTMVFVASLSHSKFFHIIAITSSSLITPFRRGAVLKPMNFENENAETFGLGKISELSMKQKFDTLACVECGRCTNVCPANLAGKPLNPKTIITKMRDFLFANKKAGIKDAEIWPEATGTGTNLYLSNELDSCTTCGACMEECPANIEHVNLIMDLKRYKALTLGDLPPAAADAVAKVKKNGNPWGIAQEDRFNWAQGMDVPVIEQGKKVDYLYYVGCAGSYDGSNQKVVKATIDLMKKAGVSFAVMGKTEKCNGDPVRRFGDEYSFYEIAIENIANMRQYTFEKVVTHCPHCLHTIGKEYAKFENGEFETVHHTELLADLVKSGKLMPTKEINEKFTFHDPCYLGRHHGEYDAPRTILESIPGLELKEMERKKDKALCCGMGGGNMWYELPEGEHLSHNRLKDIAETEVEKLATACSYCMINFNSAKGHKQETENLSVEDIAQILHKSIM